MNTLDYFLLCENVIVDKADRVSVVNIFDIIYVTSLPASHPHLVFTFRFIPHKKVSTNREISFKLTIDDPAEKTFFTAQGQATVTKDFQEESKIASSLDLTGIIFKKAGKYVARLYVDEKLLAEKSFEVKFQDGVKANATNSSN